MVFASEIALVANFQLIQIQNEKSLPSKFQECLSYLELGPVDLVVAITVILVDLLLDLVVQEILILQQPL